METDVEDIVVGSVIESAVEKAGDSAFGESIEAKDLMGPLFADAPVAAKIVMGCVGLLAGAPILLLMKSAIWARKSSERGLRR